MSVTLVDIKNHLFSHFLTSTVFDLTTDISTIKLPKGALTDGLDKQKDALFKAALEDFKRVNIVAELGQTGSGIYILTQPLNTFTQTVSITPMTAEMVADLINDVGQMLTGRKYVSNKLGLTDTDIQMLCNMCHNLLDESMHFDGEEGPDGPTPGAN